MKTPDHTNSYGAPASSRRITGLAIVIALHLLLGYALVSGMARNGLNLIKKPLEAVVIQEVVIPPPPPPPPPPKVITPPAPTAPVVEAPPPFVPPPEVAAPISTAPAIETTSTPPPPAVSAPPRPDRSDIQVACPVQRPPEMPRKARQEGIQGVVKAQALIKDGAVKEVTILSGPTVFHSAVRSAMLKYKCNADVGEVLAIQEFNFRLE